MDLTNAAPEHAPAIVALCEEMDRFYGAYTPEPYETRLRRVRDGLFGEPPTAHALLAWEDDGLVGMAAYTFVWPGIDLTRTLYLKELYVTRERRGTGVGSALMAALFETAAERGCARVEWTTDSGNEAARRFYARLGDHRLPTKLHYRADLR